MAHGLKLNVTCRVRFEVGHPLFFLSELAYLFDSLNLSLKTFHGHKLCRLRVSHGYLNLLVNHSLYLLESISRKCKVTVCTGLDHVADFVQRFACCRIHLQRSPEALHRR